MTDNRKKMLAQANLKCTGKRLAILDYLARCRKPVTAEEIAEQIDVTAHVSTVYRFLGTLAEKEILLREIHQNGVAYYQFPQMRHCHLLTCRLCRRSVNLPHCPLADLQPQLEQQTGYHITGHLLEFVGICPACAAKEKQ